MYDLVEFYGISTIVADLMPMGIFISPEKPGLFLRFVKE